MELPDLHNKYWVLRHGRSVPNELDLIVSHEANGVLPGYGLAPQGLVQARNAGKIFVKELKKFSLDNVWIYSSPFSRTIQTSECVLEAVDASFENTRIHVLSELRERYFGPFYELKSRLEYSHDDRKDPFVGPEGGESVMDVYERVLKAIHEIERQTHGSAVLIVGHGDVLQILQAVVDYRSSEKLGTYEELASSLSKHKRFELSNGELRELN